MKDIIKEVLDRYADSQINLAAPFSRELLASKIAKAIEERCDDAMLTWFEKEDKGL
jgi:hypothetical protein